MVKRKRSLFFPISCIYSKYISLLLCSFFIIIISSYFFISSPRSERRIYTAKLFPTAYFSKPFALWKVVNTGRCLVNLGALYARSFLRCWSSFANLRDTIDWTTPLPIPYRHPTFPRENVSLRQEADLFSLLSFMLCTLRYDILVARLRLARKMKFTGDDKSVNFFFPPFLRSLFNSFLEFSSSFLFFKFLKNLLTLFFSLYFIFRWIYRFFQICSSIVFFIVE